MDTHGTNSSNVEQKGYHSRMTDLKLPCFVTIALDAAVCFRP